MVLNSTDTGLNPIDAVFNWSLIGIKRDILESFLLGLGGIKM